MTRRGAALELAVLGLLHDAPMHGYELRKQLIALLGWGRVLSYGTLYPCLKALVKDGFIVADPPAPKSAKTKAKAAQTLRSVTGNDGGADIARLWLVVGNVG